MPRFVVLLRGINVGKGKRVPMAELRALLEGFGYRDVKTLLNSGNAVFAAEGKSVATHAERIESGIAASMGVAVPVIVKSAADLNRIAAENPLISAATEPSRLLVAFTRDAKSLQDLRPLAALATPPERFVLGRSAAYLWCPQGILESRAAEALLGKLGRGATTRNWATVGKILALLGEG